jgi:hypothetical protein
MEETGPQNKLERWGLDRLEAQVYLALLRNADSAGATTIATMAGIPRPSVYPVLKSLAEKNLIENGQGYGSRFAAIPPDEALPRFIAAEKEHLSEREYLTGELIKDLGSLAAQKKRPSETKLIELIRDPRVVAERFQKLQEETEHEIVALVRPPMMATKRKHKGNPAEAETLRHGVRHRAIYEESILKHENIGPYLSGWIRAGEEARVYRGELPLKLALFDAQTAWIPLETNAPRHPVVSVLIRHHALGRALHVLFDYLWKESEPIRLGRRRTRKFSQERADSSR